MIKLINVSYKVLLLFVMISISACSVFSPVKIESPKQYMLQDTPHVKKHKIKQSDSILVAPVTANPLYDTINMAYMQHPYELSYFVKNEWAESPTKMLQMQIVTTLNKTHYYRGVLTQPAYARYNYILNVHLTELKQIFVNQRSYYKISLHAELIHARTSKLIASKDFSVSQPASQNNALGGVIAANQGSKKILRQLAEFCLRYT